MTATEPGAGAGLVALVGKMHDLATDRAAQLRERETLLIHLMHELQTALRESKHNLDIDGSVDALAALQEAVIDCLRRVTL
ncbi:hypothetical protein [Tomitella biformata]|uniref:hypothetical protein n=1 Tax=Tomitella biformata TaxID=630403 RepID=UPI00046306FA|nr:hypothetical protein [Tomitella biformata]